jgi:hypothetical protein
MSKSPAPELSRRTVFAGAGAAASAAAAVALLPQLRPQAPAAGAGTPNASDTAAGYQVTEHVLHYYRTARV